MAATIPIAVVAVRGARRGWLPVGDDAYTAIRGHDVFSRHPPLLGTWSTASEWAHTRIMHPGPLQFDVAAIPVRLLGPGWGVALATAAVNIVSVATVAWWARRLLGARGALVAMLFTAGLLWSMGSELLYDPWSQHAPLLPFLAFLFTVWATAAGRASAFPALVLSGSYALQTHLSYSLLIPGLSAWALLGWALARRGRAHTEGSWRTRAGDLRWMVIAIAIGFLCWLQPLIDQVTSAQGNLGRLVASAGTRPPATPGAKGALQMVGNIVGIPPFWLPPTWGSPPFRIDGTGRPLPLLALALVAMLLLGAWLAVLARRIGDRTALVGLVTAGLVVAFGFASATRAGAPFGGIAQGYVRWLWPISMFAWTALTVAAVRVARAHDRPHLSAAVSARLAAGLTCLAVLAGVLALPTAYNGSSAPAWSFPVTQAVSRQIMPHLTGRGPVLVRTDGSLPSFAVGPALLVELQDHGVSFVLDQAELVAQVGTHRRFNGTNARQVLAVVGVTAAPLPAGYRRIAYAPALDGGQRRTLRTLTRQVAARLAVVGQRFLDEAAVSRVPGSWPLTAALAAQRSANGDLQEFAEIVRHRAVRQDRFPGIDLRRWFDLTERWRNQTIAVWLGPVPGPASGAGS